MKLTLISTALLLSASAHAEFYAGSALGRSSLQYDMKKEVDNQLLKRGLSPYAALLAENGSPIEITNKFNSTSKQFFVGYRYNKLISVEAGYRDWGKFRTSAKINATASTHNEASTNGYDRVVFNGVDVPDHNVNVGHTGYQLNIPGYSTNGVGIHIPGYNASFNASGSAFAYGEAEATAKSTYLALVLTPRISLNQSVLLRVGVDRTKIKYSSSTSYGYSYQYKTSITNSDGRVVNNTNNHGSFVQSSTNSDSDTFLVPLVGIGYEYDFTPSLTGRIQVEHMWGKNNSGISFYSAGLIHRF